MNKIYIRGNEIATKEYVDSLSFGGGTEGSTSCVINKISAAEGATVINYDKDIRPNMQEGEVKYFYLNDALIVSEEEDEIIFSAGEIIKVSTNVSGGDASTTDSICSDNNAYEVSFVTFGDGTKSYSVNKKEYLEKWELEYADIDWDQIINKPFGEVIPQDDVYVLDYDTRTFEEEVVIEGEIYYYKYELTEEEQNIFHSIGTAEGTLRLYANGEEIDVPVTFTDGQISNAINSTISFETSDDTYLLYKDGSVITSNSTEEADLELIFIPKTEYTPIPEEFLSEDIATKKYVDDTLMDINAQDQLYIYPVEYEFATNSSPQWVDYPSYPITVSIVNKINELYKKGIYKFSIRFTNPGKAFHLDMGIIINPETHTITKVGQEGIICNSNGKPAKRITLSTSYGSFNYDSTTDSFSYPNGSFVAFFLYDETYVTSNDVLTKTNTRTYTPTANYHPATKKYVDDTITTSIAGISTISLEIVTSLPTENISTSTIYLVKDETASTDTENIYNEYVYINSAWENIGSTKTTVDLSQYSTTEELSQMLSSTLANYLTTADLTAALSDYYTKTAADSAITKATQKGVQAYFTMPEQNSENAGKVYQYLGTTNNQFTKGHFYYLEENVDISPSEGEIYSYNWIELETQNPTDLSNYSTTTQMNEAISNAIEEIETGSLSSVGDTLDMSTLEDGLYTWEGNKINTGSSTISAQMVSSPTTVLIENGKAYFHTNTGDLFVLDKETMNIKQINYMSDTLVYESTLDDYYTKTEIDNMIGDINSILDSINGEEV